MVSHLIVLKKVSPSLNNAWVCSACDPAIPLFIQQKPKSVLTKARGKCVQPLYPRTPNTGHTPNTFLLLDVWAQMWLYQLKGILVSSKNEGQVHTTAKTHLKYILLSDMNPSAKATICMIPVTWCPGKWPSPGQKTDRWLPPTGVGGRAEHSVAGETFCVSWNYNVDWLWRRLHDILFVSFYKTIHWREKFTYKNYTSAYPSKTQNLPRWRLRHRHSSVLSHLWLLTMV